MTGLEEKIWAAVFANMFCEEFSARSRLSTRPQEISGFSCAEIADVAVEKYREAIFSDDAQYLLIAKEEK